MSCNRNRCCRRDRNEVAGVQRIALRGPGCISGSGCCENVAGTGDRCRCGCRCGCGCGCRCENVLGAAEDFCDCIFGDRGRRCCDNVLGTGGGRCCDDVLGTGGGRFTCSNSHVMGIGGRRCGQVFGSGGGFQCNDVGGTGGRGNRCKHSCWGLKTPTTVPR